MKPFRHSPTVSHLLRATFSVKTRQTNRGRNLEEGKRAYWTMSGGFIFRHHAVPRSSLSVTGDEIFTIPWKHTVTRQTWTYVVGTFEHTFEHTMNDLRTESKDVTLSQGGVGTTKFQILRRWQSERHTRLHGPQAFVLENTRADSIWPEAWMKLPEKRKLDEIAE